MEKNPEDVKVEEKKEEKKESPKEEKKESPKEDKKEEAVEEDIDEIKESEGEVVKTHNEEIENTIEENELLSKDVTWDDLGIKEEIKKGLIEMAFIKPSKIQSTTFPLIMKEPARHLIAQAKNGSGKTAAFGLGIISKIDETKDCVQAVVFGHTRELVNQIHDVLSKMAKFTKIQFTTITPTNKNPEKLGQIVVCTPGSFEGYFIKKRKFGLLKNLKVLVIDEADYMLTNEVTLKACEETFLEFHKEKLLVQILFFSATFTKENFKTIKKYYKSANMLEIKKEELTLSNVRQMFFNAKTRENKVDFVEKYLASSFEQERVIIFVNSRAFVLKLREILSKKGYKVFILMGGDMDPKNRDETIKKFNSGEIQILITTNVLARGYDEKLIKLVINFDFPVKKDPKTRKLIADPETYLHRIGRTGRFGTKGIGLTLLSGDFELEYIKQIEDYYQNKLNEIKSLDDLIKEFKEFLVQGY